MPGAREALAALTLQGARLGIASNCSKSYLDHMLSDLRLGETVHDAYCLDTPGIRDKGEMIERLLQVFNTRSAIMVGDRAGDRNAAWENGVPHIHCAFGFAGQAESVEAEAQIEDLGELTAVLDRRADWIVATLARVGLHMDAAGAMVLGVTGGLASGKSLFARDAARLLRAGGQPAVAVSMEGYRRPGGATVGAGLEEQFDLERLEGELLEPIAAGESVRLPSEGSLDGGEGRFVPEDAVVLLEGPFLLEPRLQRSLDRVLFLEVSEEVLWRRLQGREGREAGLESLELLRSEVLPVFEAHREHYDPSRLADLVVDASNPLGPAPKA